jgi:hypothetical protein
MKKLIAFIGLGLFTFSCTSHLADKLGSASASDIDIEKIKDQCDCIDAIDIIASDFLGVVGNKNKKDFNRLSDRQKESLEKRIEPIMDKRKEVDRFCRKQYGVSSKNYESMAAGANCSGHKDLVSKLNDIEKRF